MALTTVSISTASTQFRRHLEIRGLTAGTLKTHSALHNHLVEVWGDISVSNITPRHIDNLFSDMQWAPATRNLYLGNVRQFFAWCRVHGYMRRDADPTTGWRNAKIPRSEKLRIPIEHFNDLMDAASHPRDRAIIAMGLFTFMRASELQTLRIGDIDLGRSEITMTRHKTREDDVMPISSELNKELVAYLNWYRADQTHLSANWFLLPAKEKVPWINDPHLGRLVDPGIVASLKPLTKVTHPYRAVQRAMAQLGYDVGGEGGHTLRRSGARALADHLRGMGYDGALLRVASMLGHKDTRMTERYIGWELERSQRNEQIAGKPMFGDLLDPTAGMLKVVGE